MVEEIKKVANESKDNTGVTTYFSDGSSSFMPAQKDTANAMVGNNSFSGISNKDIIPKGSGIISGILGSNNNISSGTEDIEDGITQGNNEINLGLGSAESGELSPSAQLAKLLSERESINSLTSDEQASIYNAGTEAGAAFDDSINQAKESRRKTLPSAVVRAGEAGGFENTQISGIAALLPTDPTKGEAFVGAGGRLDVVRQDLDRNISLLIAKKNEAIQAARAAQRKAIQTGKKADFQDSLELVKLANQFKNDAEDQMIKRNQLLLDVKAENRLTKSSEAAMKRDEESSIRAEKQYQLQEAKFINDNEDRIADAIGTQLISLDENNELVIPTREEVLALAEQEGIDANILMGKVNERIDEVSKVQLDNRKSKLEELKFIETQKQNAINNELSRMRNNISAGNLSLAQKKFLQETMGTSEGFSDKKTEAEVRSTVMDFASRMREGEEGLTADSALMELRAGFSENEVSSEALEEVWLKAIGMKKAGEEDIATGDAGAFDTGTEYNYQGDNEEIEGRIAELYEAEKEASNNFKDYSESLAISEIRNTLFREGYSEEDVMKLKKGGLTGIGESISSGFNSLIKKISGQ